MIAFAARQDQGQTGGPIAQLCDALTKGPIAKYTQASQDIDAVIDVRVVFQSSHQDLHVGALPDLLVPRKGKYGLIDYEKAFCPILGDGTDIFDLRDIDRAQGALLIVRPDQFVAQVLPLDAYAEVGAFFDGFMVARSS